MEKQYIQSNAADRKSYVGEIYNKGESLVKKEVLASLPKSWSDLHINGYIHIHDLDAYGLTYNCLTFNILEAFPYEDFNFDSDVKIIQMVFEYLKNSFEQIGNEQSGGMALANFDNDLAEIFTKLGISFEGNEAIFEASILSLIHWCNDTHTRMGKTSYYVTFNIGLAKNDFARFLAKTLLKEFKNSKWSIYKPNIVFKIADGINLKESDPNFYLLQESIECTTKKMIPTYLLCDCEMDKNTNPELLSIMGCRTRVVDNLYGNKGAIGRGNICNISINLPRIAFEVLRENKNLNFLELIEKAKQKWRDIAEITKDILLDRFEKTCETKKDIFPYLQKNNFCLLDFNDRELKDIFKNGTLSIGFIGLSEFIEILSGKKYWIDSNIYDEALEFVTFMRDFTDSLTKKYKLNFSLLATSGELISGRFCEIDKEEFKHKVCEKGFYTNSFHVEVDSRLPAYKKLMIEGPFHTCSNGGCISYLELNEAPIGNVEGIRELIDIAIQSGVHYLGLNFKKDICNDCGSEGIFDICQNCGSHNITRIRRVSGYLEIRDFFTCGKKNEEKNRKAN